MDSWIKTFTNMQASRIKCYLQYSSRNPLYRNIVAYRPVAKLWLCKQRPFLGIGWVKTFPLLGSKLLLVQQLDVTREELCFLCGPSVLPIKIEAHAKQGSAHHWKFSKVHTCPRFAHSFQPSVSIRVYHKIVQETSWSHTKSWEWTCLRYRTRWSQT
jgi:hypothetical protein